MRSNLRLILDANNLAYRGNVTNKLTTKQGEQVGAIYGTLQMIQSYLKPTSGRFTNRIYKALEQEGIHGKVFTRVIACWDHGKSQYRKELYPEYKAQREKKRREKTEEEKEDYMEFIRQMNELHDFLPNLGVISLKSKGWEADDLIYVATTQNTEDITVIVTTDRDMLQLVDEKVFVWSPFKEKLITPANFVQETGVSKESYLDFRALVGDSSDNIKGVPGIGEKTAKSLILRYGNMDGILKGQTELRKSVRTARIFENLDVIDRNKMLMDLEKAPTDEIEPYVKTALSMNVSVNDKVVKNFFISKQFISLLTSYLGWIQPFKKLK